jgi:hypothetical protein
VFRIDAGSLPNSNLRLWRHFAPMGLAVFYRDGWNFMTRRELDQSVLMEVEKRRDRDNEPTDTIPRERFGGAVEVPLAGNRDELH